MLRMPEPDAVVLARRVQIAEDLRAMLPADSVIADEHQRRVYESDGLTAYRQLPMIVVLPETTAQVSQVLKYCSENNVKIVPRGAGTSLSGGALPLADGVTLGLGKFKQVLDIDLPNSLRRRPAGRHQSGRDPGGPAPGLLLRPGPLQPDRLHHRRKRGGEFWGRALPQIWHHHQ